MWQACKATLMFRIWIASGWLLHQAENQLCGYPCAWWTPCGSQPENVTTLTCDVLLMTLAALTLGNATKATSPLLNCALCHPLALPVHGLPSLPSYQRTALQTHTEGSVGGGAPAASPDTASVMNWPEWWGHTNSMICIIPVNKMSPCAVVFVQNVLQPFFQQALFNPLPFYYSYYKCVIEFRKLYDSSSVSVLFCVAYLNPWLPALKYGIPHLSGLFDWREQPCKINYRKGTFGVQTREWETASNHFRTWRGNPTQSKRKFSIR